MPKPRVIVVGGGAGGFFGAIHACSPTNEVLLLEAGREILSKVKISGGGRCNVTHSCFEPAQLVQSYPRGGKALRGAFSRFQPRDTIEWFRNQGVQLKIEDDGRIFPTSDDSATIVECLQVAAKRSGVVVQTQTPVVGVTKNTGGFEVRLKSGDALRADNLLLASGSSTLGFKLANSLGHTIVEPVPSLFTLGIKDQDLQELAGVSLDRVEVFLKISPKLNQTGGLIITHWGLSGPAVLKLSAWGARLLHECRYQTPIGVNWLPGFGESEILSSLQILRTEQPKRQIRSNPQFGLPRRLWQFLTDRSGIKQDQKWAELSKINLLQLSQNLIKSEFQVSGKGVFKEEFVTCGGVSLGEVDFKRMESKLAQGCHFAGEILDIDGVTGGFNFQSAWTTGYLAGMAIRSG